LAEAKNPTEHQHFFCDEEEQKSWGQGGRIHNLKKNKTCPRIYNFKIITGGRADLKRLTSWTGGRG